MIDKDLPIATLHLLIYERENMKQQHTLMKFDPATGSEKPYPSHAEQWRHWHGKATAWLFNPWTGERRNAGDVGSDAFGLLIQPPGEPLYAGDSDIPLLDDVIKRAILANSHPADDFYVAFINEEEMLTAGRRIARDLAGDLYRDLLNRLGVYGHSGAVAEISRLRESCGLGG